MEGKQRHNKICTPIKVVVLIFMALSSMPAQPAGKKDSGVTAVEGESWLRHLHRAFDWSSMGRTWSLGPPAPIPGDKVANWQPALSLDFSHKTVALRGSDLYRLNCRGCHQESGQGAPPEINSIINPVRATSIDAVMQRMKDRGIDMSRADAAALAKQANDALMERLHKGGQDMPPFPYLSEPEIRALAGYLKELACVPSAGKDQGPVIQSTALHIGEQVVKSNCHICHGATGANPSPKQIMDGAIPPLSTLPARKILADFVQKVTVGAPILMGNPPEWCRGRMSVFYYLSQDEAASAYLYLSVYPPKDVGY